LAQNSNTGKDDLASAAGGIGGIIIILVVLFAGFLNAPGMLLMGILNDAAKLHLDCGQMWTFSLIISVALYITLRISYKVNAEASVMYLFICIAIVAVFLIAKFGFKAHFPGRIISNFINL